MVIDPIKQIQDEQVMIQQAFNEVLNVYTHSPHRQKVEIIQKAFEFAN